MGNCPGKQEEIVNNKRENCPTFVSVSVSNTNEILRVAEETSNVRKEIDSRVKEMRLLSGVSLGIRLMLLLEDVAPKSSLASQIVKLIQQGNDPEEVMFSSLLHLLERESELVDQNTELLSKKPPPVFIPTEEVGNLKSANAYKAELLSEVSKLISVLVEENFDTSHFSEFYKDKFRDFLTKTWSD